MIIIQQSSDKQEAVSGRVGEAELEKGKIKYGEHTQCKLLPEMFLLLIK